MKEPLVRLRNGNIYPEDISKKYVVFSIVGIVTLVLLITFPLWIILYRQ